MFKLKPENCSYWFFGQGNSYEPRTFCDQRFSSKQSNYSKIRKGCRNQAITSSVLNTTINVKTTNSGSTHTFKYLPKALRLDRVSALITSFVPNRNISSIVANNPKDTPLANVAIVVTVVVVTVEIMADN